MKGLLPSRNARGWGASDRAGTAAAATAVALLLIVAGALLPQGAATAATPTQLTNLGVSWSGGLLQRTQVKYVTVSMTLVDPDGISPSDVVFYQRDLACPCVVFQKTPMTGQGRPYRIVTLHLTSGTSTNGVWSGRFAVGAADYGIWRPTAKAAGDIMGVDPFENPAPTSVPTPWDQVTVNVRGYDWPRAWLGTPVPSGSRFMISGGVGLSRSSVAVAGLRLEIRTPCNLVAEPSSMRTAVRTNSAGRYSYTLSAAEAREDTWACAAWVIYPTDTPDSWGVQSNIRRHG